MLPAWIHLPEPHGVALVPSSGFTAYQCDRSQGIFVLLELCPALPLVLGCPWHCWPEHNGHCGCPVRAHSGGAPLCHPCRAPVPAGENVGSMQSRPRAPPC